MNTHEAKINFNQLVTQVANGKEVIITRSGKDFAKITPLKSVSSKRIGGQDSGIAEVSEDFNAPLPDELRKFFE
jgi:prevent-host-death family protein